MPKKEAKKCVVKPGVHFLIEVGVSSIVINFREDIVIHFPEETGRMRLGSSSTTTQLLLSSILMIFG